MISNCLAIQFNLRGWTSNVNYVGNDVLVCVNIIINYNRFEFNLRWFSLHDDDWKRRRLNGVRINSMKSNFFWKPNWRNNHFERWLNSVHGKYSPRSSFRLKLPSHLHIEENRPPFKDMINISCFFYLAKAVGLAPYSLQVSVKHSRVASAFLRFLRIFPTVLYSLLVCSIFWKNKAASEISNTVNWIQVSLFCRRKNVFCDENFKNSAPPPTVHPQRNDFPYHSCQRREFSLDDSIRWNVDSRFGWKAETFSSLICRLKQTNQAIVALRNIS